MAEPGSEPTSSAQSQNPAAAAPQGGLSIQPTKTEAATPKPEPIPTPAPAPSPTPVAAKPAMPKEASLPAPTTQAVSKVAPPAKAETTPEKDQNVFTELFGKKDAAAGSNVMSAVNKQEESKKKSFFGSKPKLDSIEDKKTKDQLKKIKSTGPGSSILQASFLILLLTGSFFYSQNSKQFGPFGYLNPAQEEVLVQNQVDHLQAEIVLQNHLSAVLLLDQFSSIADAYLYNVQQSESEFNSQNKRTEYSDEAEVLRPELETLLVDIQDSLINYQDVNSALPKEVADEWIDEILGRGGEVDEQGLLQDVQDLESTKTLMQSSSFKDNVLAMNPDKLSDDEVQYIYEEYSKISRSVTSLMAEIKAERIDWGYYIEEFERVTKSVDPLFNTEFEGNLTIGDMRLSATGGISITGSTNTSDSKNFSLVADLIDAYEESDYFQNVNERSFSKSEAENEYLGSFQISMNLEFPDLLDNE